MNVNIFDIKHFAVHDGDGIRTTVFFSGCPLKCKWCHNPEGLQSSPLLAWYGHLCTNCRACASVCPNGVHVFEDDIHKVLRENCIHCGACVDICPNEALKIYGKSVSTEEVICELLQDRAFYDASSGGITLSGGECLLQPSACQEILRAVKEEGIHTAVDTCGYVEREAIDCVLPYTDVFLYDIKHINSQRHREGTGCGNEKILKNLLYLSQSGAQIEVRIPLIPYFNFDSIPQIGAFLAPLKGIIGVRVLQYHNYAHSKYLALDILDTLPEMPKNSNVEQARDCLASYGLRVFK